MRISVYDIYPTDPVERSYLSSSLTSLLSILARLSTFSLIVFLPLYSSSITFVPTKYPFTKKINDFAIIPEKKQLWLATDEGMFVRDLPTLKSIKDYDHLNENSNLKFSSVVYHNHKVWASRISGLTVFDLEKNKDNGLIFIGLNEIEKKMPDTGKPSHFRLPDGEVVAIKTWKAVLLESCKYVLSKVENLQLPLVDKAGKSTLLISEIKPSEKVSFIETSYQDKTVYIYLNYAASLCISNAAYVLKHCLPEDHKALPAVVIA